MPDHESLTAVVAHDLLNAMTSIEGLLATAKTLTEQDSTDQECLAYVLDVAHTKAQRVSRNLQALMRGVPEP